MGGMGGEKSRRASTTSGHQNQPNEGRQLSQAPPKAAATPAPAAPATRTTATPRPDTNIAGDIAKLLKLHYYRTIFRDAESKDGQAPRRSYDSAIDFLFGENPKDIDIGFVYPPTQRQKLVPINFGRFEENYKLLTFDRALLYVDFRRVELQASDNKRVIERSKDDGPGRRDMVRFFQWLYEKRVRNIVSVTVEDREGTPHCDEAIIQALKSFNVEILDWRKVDLCPLALQKACAESPNIRELHLWWGGSNAVLRAWSEPDGLVQLLSLETIYIYQAKAPLDSTKCLEDNFNDFKRRLNNARRALFRTVVKVLAKWSITLKDTLKHKLRGKLLLKRVEFKEVAIEMRTHKELHDPSAGALGADSQLPETALGEINEYEWLRVTDAFAKSIQGLQSQKSKLPDYLTREGPPKELLQPVKVALIDDGVDWMHSAINSTLLPGKSIDSGLRAPSRSGKKEPYHGSTTGHGTFMAYTIQRICPDVRIYPYRIDVLRQASGPVTFTARSAADAVEDAVKRGFDIISMSWTVQRNDDKDSNNHPTAANNTAHLDRLVKALQLATDKTRNGGKEILLFASSPDVGRSNSQNRYYPFDCEDIPKVFHIGAGSAEGEALPKTGNKVDFILPGEEIFMKPADKIEQEDNSPKTGSSVATAHAAGLAAMIIQCVRMGAVHNFYTGNAAGVTVDSLRTIKTYDAMRTAFKIINSGSEDRRLLVEEYLRGYGRDLGSGSGLSDENKWTKLSEIARELVPYKSENATH